MARVPLTLALALVALTTLAVAAGNDISDQPLWLALLSWSCFVVLAVSAIACLLRLRPPFWRIVAAAAGLYCAGCLALALFQLASPYGLDLDFVLARPKDSLKTMVRMIGWPASVLAGLAAAGLVVAFSGSLTLFARPLAATPRRRHAAVLMAVAVLAGVVLTGLPHPYLRAPAGARSGIDILPAVPRQALPPLTRNESVFFLQLESVNALVASDAYTIHGKAIPADPMTAMRQLARKGIFFPHIWSQGVQTHRAQEAILCGAVGNVHSPFFDRLIPWEGQCLPAILRKAGYRTVYLKSVKDRDFGDAADFMTRVGFDDVHFADFMKPGDPMARWGYDEKIFYTRAFEYLRSRYRPDEKLFVYLAVCAHHYGFTRDATTDMNFLLAEQEQRLGMYLWSQKIQDESLLTFDRLTREFAGEAAHVFYAPDHSIPLGLYGARAPSVGATIDNFMTTLLYVPPASRASELALGRTLDDVSYAHADLLPTITELLSDTPQPNSLVPFMRRTPPAAAQYEQCHVMAQPWDGRRLLIARGNAAYEYHVATQTLREFRIRRNPMRQDLVRATEGVTYQEFERRFGCSRYRRNA